MYKKRMTNTDLNLLVLDVICEIGNDFINNAVELGLITCNSNGNIIDKKNKELKEYLEKRGVKFTYSISRYSYGATYIHIAEWYSV